MNKNAINVIAFICGFLCIFIAGIASAEYTSGYDGSGCDKQTACTSSTRESTSSTSTCYPQGAPVQATQTRTYSFNWEGTDPNNGTCWMQFTDSATACHSGSSGQLSTGISGSECEDLCEDLVGTTEVVSTFAGGNACGKNNCEMSVTAPESDDLIVGMCLGEGCANENVVKHWYGTGTYSGVQCGQDDETPEIKEEKCATTETGREICVSETDNNCGTVNGEEICVDPDAQCGTVNGAEICADEQQCVKLPSGIVVCPKDAPAPDKEDESGDKEEPEAMLGNENGETLTLYGGGLVEGDGYGSGEGDDGSDNGQCEGTPEECQPGEGEGQIETGERSARTFQQSLGVLQGYWSENFVQPLDRLDGAIPDGSGVCPTANFNLFDKAYEINSHCQLVEDQRTLLQGIFVLFWSLLAVFIILKA